MPHNLRKRWLKAETYIDKNVFKHKHDYKLKHLLIVTNINEHASGNYYKRKEYYYVLKCNQCNSFIPDIVKGNYNHHIFKDEEIDDSLPVITANTNYKCPHYEFGKLFDVNVEK